jgi:hypothetical protein
MSVLRSWKLVKMPPDRKVYSTLPMCALALNVSPQTDSMLFQDQEVSLLQDEVRLRGVLNVGSYVCRHQYS